MQIYLPIAEIAVNMLVIFGMGAAVGFLSGMFGVGGGFLLTPLLVFSGIPPAVAVGTVTSQIVASSASGALTYWRRGAVDWKLAGFLIASGIVGSALGVVVFRLLALIGQLDLVVGLCYVVFLGFIGIVMINESIRAILASRRGGAEPIRQAGLHTWLHHLPLKVRFRRSRIYVSALPVLSVGLFIGFLGTLLGIGGGFIMVPALIYLFRVPTNVVVGTSLVQILGTMAVATVLQAVTNQTVDAVLALILMIGGVIGAQFGTQIGAKLRGEQLRALLGLMVLAIAARFFFELVIAPAEIYTVAPLTGQPS